MSDVLQVSRDGAVVTLTLNRPDKLNALNAELVGALKEAVDRLSKDPSVGVAILTGAGEKAFAAGADIAAMAKMSVAEAQGFSDLGHAVGHAIETAHFPVIGAVNGFALGGGCELALACDFLYASDRAKFGQPEVKLGVIPGFGGTQRLARRVGVGLARELCYTGTIIDAQHALRINLVNAVVPGAELMSKVLDVARTITAMGPKAVAACKQVLLQGPDLPLREANALEARTFASLFSTDDQREGMAAFVEKRPARFKGV
ncbi:MAG TPA: enoyl-CoA hydratase-related protein [Polyangiaceae bacterium]|jgi:enoyl-CoA hydratase|nr:enoyl-CoA hydratase-related protein [Polyangiaceae bacterium]